MATKTFKIGLSDADKTNMAQDILEQVEGMLFEEYDASKTYHQGDYTVYQGALFRCLQDNVTGTWNPAYWALATLQDLVEQVNEAVDTIDNKANVDGNYPTMTVGLADNLTPYSEDSGAEQEQPFISQGTGCGNGTEIVTTGDYALLREKQGHTLVANQYVHTSNFPSVESDFTDGVKVSAVDTEKGTITITVDTGGATANRSFNVLKNTGSYALSLIASHHYLQMGCPSGGSTSTYFLGISSSATYNPDTGNGGILTNYSGGYNFNINIRQGCPAGTYVFKPRFVDLDQMFNGDIPQDLLDHPENFFRYYNGSLAYNLGSLENSNGRYLVATGRNIWDEEWENGAIGSNGSKTSSDSIRSKNLCNAIPNTQYYSNKYLRMCYYDKDGVFIGRDSSAGILHTTPSNCCYFKITLPNNYGTPYNNDITISLYYTPEQGGEGYDQYYPYEEPTIVDTGSEVLRSAGNVKDYKTPDGTIHRLVGTRAYQSGDENDSSLLTDGTITYYPLETPTTEQGTTFPENIKINDYGMMYWLDSSNNLVSIPQGNKLFYPVNYKGFVDDVYSRTEGDASKLVIQSELSDKFETYLKSLSGYDATATQVLKNVEGTLTWVTEE